MQTFENVMIRHANDKQFEKNFYINNGSNPPIVPEQDEDETDSEQTEYTICDKWPETGFIIEKPKQPETPGVCDFAISTE